MRQIAVVGTRLRTASKSKRKAPEINSGTFLIWNKIELDIGAPMRR